MKEKQFIRCLFFILSLLILLSFSMVLLKPSCWAGQVITEEIRTWARKVMQEEKSLDALSLPNTVAVLYLYNKTERKELIPLQKGLALMLITDLSKVKGIQVVERINIQALTDEMGLAISGLVDPNTVPRIGKLLRAKWILGGEFIEPKPPVFTIKSNLLDTSDQKIIKQPSASGNLTEIFDMEKDILFDIIKFLKIELTPAEEEDLKKPLSHNINAVMELFKGIDASDKGDYENSEKHYNEALKADPKLSLAKEFLTELKSLGLIPIKKRGRNLLKSLRNRASLTDQHAPEDPVKRALNPKLLSDLLDMIRVENGGNQEYRPTYDYDETNTYNDENYGENF